MAFNVYISEATGSGKKATSYTRILPDQLGKMMSKCHSVVISMGRGVEHVIEDCFHFEQQLSVEEIDNVLSGTNRVPSTEDAEYFSDGVKFFTYLNFAKTKWAKKHAMQLDGLKKPDCFIVHGGGEFGDVLTIVESKLGNQFDTKKLDGEIQALSKMYDFLKQNVPKNFVDVYPVITSASQIENEIEFRTGFKNKIKICDSYDGIYDGTPCVWRLQDFLETWCGLVNDAPLQAFNNKDQSTEVKLENANFLIQNVLQYIAEHSESLDKISRNKLRQVSRLV